MMGNVSVITYENPYTFHQKPDFQPYVDIPHICATRSLEVGVRQRHQLPHVQSIGSIVDRFYPGWNLPENRFIQYTQLSDLLRKWDNSLEPEVIRSFKRNKLNLLITMRNFTEIGLKPSTLRQNVTKLEEKLFCDIWEGMLPFFKNYMEKAEAKVKDLECIRNVFKHAGIPLSNDTIVLHGFYYI